jgi:hypothetical protein
MPPILGDVAGLDSAARRLDMRVGGDMGRASAAAAAAVVARSVCDWDWKYEILSDMSGERTRGACVCAAATLAVLGGCSPCGAAAASDRGTGTRVGEPPLLEYAIGVAPRVGWLDAKAAAGA